ncbi:MAG: alpha/beta hydrolase family protein [Myxococcales bacterium]|nr:alpha/beta hydrolase family protein [Myxococcales bacterium]
MPRSKVVSRIAHESCVQAPRITTPRRWWNSLETNFAHRPEAFELDLRDSLLVRATAAMDVGIRTFAASAVGTLAIPMGYGPRQIRELMREKEHYELLADAGDPNAFFRPPSRRVPIDAKPALVPLFKPKDGVCEDLTFESPFQPSNPNLRAAYQKHTGNRRAHARLWSHDGGPRPTLVAIHGFGAEQSWINEWMLALPHFYKLGLNVMLMTLPFHGPRRTRFSPFSGHGFFAGGALRTNEAFAQGVHDFRVFLDHLMNDRGVEQVGVTGISLGGCTTALIASVEPRISFAIPNVPVVSLADLMLEWRPLSGYVRALLAATGMSVRDLRYALAASSPMTWDPVLPRERLMIVAGVGDRVAPPKHSRILWEHWNRCRLHWFPGGHVLHLDKGEYLVEMARFLRELDFLPGPGR